ncbi:MAG: nadA [Haloplasmataceae bacterium]|nr:nadA [Haloplasmataceae bacterium]
MEINFVQEINRLKKEKNAIILAHYYQRPEVQDVADYLGDSLALSRVAAKTDADIIVFCGVHFMAETAKILSPNKKVLLPVKEAGCPMAEMVTDTLLQKYKDEHPDVKVICYVNSTAKVKALSDVCVTSSNAEKVVSQYIGQKLLYIPDKNLGIYLREKFNLDMEVWKGFCCIHNDVTKDQVIKEKELHPLAQFIVHPECQLEIVKMADFVGSTKGLLDYVTKSDCQEFIVGTEKGIIHQMEIKCPNKKFYLLTQNLSCFDMKLTNLEDVYTALKNEENVIEVEESIRLKALKSLNKMFEYTDN